MESNGANEKMRKSPANHHRRVFTVYPTIRKCKRKKHDSEGIERQVGGSRKEGGVGLKKI